MRQKRKLAENVWYQVRPSVTLSSRVARSLPPRRGGVQATPQAQHKVEPVSGAVLGGAAVEAMAKTKIPAAKTYKPTWVSPRRTGGTVKVRFSFKTPLVSTNPPG
jgi:hypothetical protein